MKAMDLAKHVKQLTGEADWPLWKRKMRDILDYHEGALEVIDGKMVKPEPLDEGATADVRKEHKAKADIFRKANSYAKTLISSAVADSVYQKIMDKESAKEAWDALKLLYEASSQDQLFKICTDFFAFGWCHDDDVSTHTAKLSSLFNELNMGLRAKNQNPLPDLLLVCKALQILPQKFENFRSGWMLLSKDSEKGFEDLVHQLCMFERNFKTTESETTEALQLRRGTSRQQDRRKNDLCHYCKKTGHFIRQCAKWIADGRPRKSEKVLHEVQPGRVALTLSHEVCEIAADATRWWIDNGATQHVTHCAEFFVEFRKFEDTHKVKAAGGELLQAIGKGTIQVRTDGGRELSLSDVWYVPKVSRNLFSVLAAHDKCEKSKFTSSATECAFELDGRVIFKGNRRKCGTLYEAGFTPVSPRSEVNFNSSSGSQLQLYHERFGHQDKRHVKDLMERELGISVKLERSLCEPCVYGKSHRLKFGRRKTSEKPGQLISADIVGPFDVSFKQHRFVVIFKDDFTKFKYGFFLAKKSEVPTVLTEVIAHASNLGHKILEFLSDNGGEFDSKEVRCILAKAGITQRLTAPFCPEENGGSERENRTIVEMARTLKYANPEVVFPKAIWEELVGASIYILNRTGKSWVQGYTPYELWMGKKPRIKHLRVIGCTCYPHVPHQKRLKMDKKALKGYLVGYDGDECYRVYMGTREGHKVIRARDVEFDERLSGCGIQVKLPLKDHQSGEQDFEDSRDMEKTAVPQQDSEKDESREQTKKSDNQEGRGQAKAENPDQGKAESSSEESEPSAGGNSPVKDAASGALNWGKAFLRNSLSLKRPAYLDDYATLVELFQLYEAPQTYSEAINSDKSAEWKKAMDSEMASLKENDTWDVVELPKGAKAIACKWVYRVKETQDGQIERYKARVVIKGFSQRYGLDYRETFSPVAKLTTIRSILGVATNEGLCLGQFDVTTAFLYGDLEEDFDIYMQSPEGYENPGGKVCKLKRSLYGLKQAPRRWNVRFITYIKKLGLVESEADPCLFIRETENEKLLLAIYVDDGLLAASNESTLRACLEGLRLQFKITSKDASYFLGLEIKRESDRIRISQAPQARKILERYNFAGCKPVTTPMISPVEAEKEGPELSEGQPAPAAGFPFRQAVGAIMYLMLGSRPDLAYSIGVLSRKLENPDENDIRMLKRVLRYIAGTIDFGITYTRTGTAAVLEAYSDSDYGGCFQTGRSTSGIVVKYAGGAISWMSQRQTSVATSTTEAEIVAASEAAKEAVWLRRLFKEIARLDATPTVFVDNAAAVKLSHNPEFHRRTKHISLRHFYIRERVVDKELEVQQISTENQVADLLTKVLLRVRHQYLCKLLGMS